MRLFSSLLLKRSYLTASCSSLENRQSVECAQVCCTFVLVNVNACLFKEGHQWKGSFAFQLQLHGSPACKAHSEPRNPSCRIGTRKAAMRKACKDLPQWIDRQCGSSSDTVIWWLCCARMGQSSLAAAVEPNNNTAILRDEMNNVQNTGSKLKRSLELSQIDRGCTIVKFKARVIRGAAGR